MSYVVLRMIFGIAMIATFVVGVGCGICQHWNAGTYFLVLSIILGKILFGKVDQ